MRSAEGSIIELDKGKRYRVMVTAGYDKNGKRIRKTATVRGSRKDAERKKIELLIAAGVDVQTELTLEEYIIEYFLPQRRKTTKASTVENYERRIRNHMLPAIGDVKLSELTPAIIRRWLENVGAPTVQRECRKMIKMICQQAMYDDHLASNPVDRVKPPKVKQYNPDVLDAQDCEVYLWHFRDTRSEPAVLIAIGCGLRRGEIIALNVDDINPVTGAVTVDDAYVPVKSGVKHETPKSESGYRVVHMPKVLLDRLLQIIPKSGPVIQKLDGSRMRPEVLTHLYEKERRTLPSDVPRISLKNLRHTSLTMAYDTSGDIMAVKERAGHSSINITQRYYVRPKGERDVQTAKLISNKLE